MAALCVVLAGGFLLRQHLHRGAGIAPSDSPTYWYCRHCQNGFALTAAEYQKVLSLQAEPSPKRRMNSLERTMPTVRCPVCGGRAVSAYRCIADGTIFDPRPTDGGAARGCPKCGWNPLSR